MVVRRFAVCTRLLAALVALWVVVGGTGLADGFPKTLTDGTGRSIVLAEAPSRIFSSGLAMDNILLSLVEPERVIAVTRFASNPDYSYVADKIRPHMTLIDALNAELVVAADPDLVLVAFWSEGDPVRQIRELGYPVYTFTGFSTVQDSLDMILEIGELTGTEEKAREIVSAFHAALAEIQTRLEGRERPRVFYWNSWGSTTGTFTANHDIIEMAGGINVAAEAGIEGWKDIGTETVLSLNPDVIITDSGEEFLQQILADQALASIPAIQSGRVYHIDHMDALNHHFILAIEALAEKLHPEVFP